MITSRSLSRSLVALCLFLALSKGSGAWVSSSVGESSGFSVYALRTSKGSDFQLVCRIPSTCLGGLVYGSCTTFDITGMGITGGG
ncbi:hypothetical protein JB92DRAFT_3062708 [Gautieria morchelliformis]|nr:hypothetical protein JB92DRAFT_3062708 [Gautieria morchelliformis]